MEMTYINLTKLRRQLKQWGIRLDDLAAEADQAGAEVPNAHHELIAELKSKHQIAEAKLLELKDAGGEHLDRHWAGAERAWHDLEASIAKLAN